MLAKLDLPFSTPDFLDKTYIPSLDGWRAVGIILVVLGHAKLSITKCHLKLQVIFSHFPSRLGVDIFLVISGFLITALFIKETIRHNKINIKHFFIRRFLRLIPAFYFYLASISLLGPIFNVDITLENILVSILYVSNFVDINKNAWATVHTWSLSLEEQFYFIWPFLFSCVKKSYQICVIIILLLPVVRIINYIYPGYENFYLYPFINRGASIFTGAMLAILVFKGFFVKTYLPIAMLAALIILYVNYYDNQGISGIFIYPFGYLSCNLSIAYLLLFTLQHEKNLLFKFLNNKIIIEVGLMSYSIYLWQQFFIFPVGLFPKLENYSFFPFNIFLAAFMAFISYNFIEKFFKRFKVNLKI